MNLRDLVLVKQKEQKKMTSTIAIDEELAKELRRLKWETGWSMQHIAEDFIRYGLMRVKVLDEDGNEL